MNLQPCSRCHRHVEVSTRQCPFCGTAVALAVPRTAVSVSMPLVGRVSRAAVFAGLAACWTGSTPTTTTPATTTPTPEDTSRGSGADATTPGAGVVVAGIVTDAATARPLAHVAVELRDASGRVGAVNTDEHGRYELAAVAPGDYQLVFRYGGGDVAGTTQRPITVRDVPAQLDVSMQLVHRAPMPKPYGAPPARRRVV